MSATKSAIVARIVINAVMLLPYGVILLSDQQASAWWAVPLLIWGAVAFKHIASTIAIPLIHIPVSGVGYFFSLLAGAVFCAAIGIVIIPILILVDLGKLFLS